MHKIEVIAVHLQRPLNEQVRVQLLEHSEVGTVEVLLDERYRLDADDARHELVSYVGTTVESVLWRVIESVR